MKNLKKLTRIDLKSITGGLFRENNCHCHGSTPSSPNQGLPPIDIPSDSAAQCFNTCACYRGEPGCIK
ncbi:bacteriocin-like protein [Chryseobacterium populi]